ncbi:hypothetical protein B484DRAFT_453060 [Ochromonadaceae sp. CCMP2298]|nr:hypothetical protein B484DRAFT_453060 [Ochromonadaceae sp. CCMP2298]
METQEAPLQVGDKLVLHWPSEGETTRKVHAKVLSVLSQRHKSKEGGGKRKNIQVFKYELSFYKEGVTVHTRLEGVQWKVKDKKEKEKEEKDHDTKNRDKKRKRKGEDVMTHKLPKQVPAATATPTSTTSGTSGPIVTPARGDRPALTWDSLHHIVAPMVGGSELAFRLLCRRYGATLAYTPMMNSERFAVDKAYREEEFQTCTEDRPLVAHFSANDPRAFLAAAKLVQHQCDAIDLNLGCPQRVAFSGHFGSYLLGPDDRDLVLSLVRTLADAHKAGELSVPIFVKIRLLDSVPETLELCQQLYEAGAALIAVHGRYRVNLVGRTGAGARDGPAHLDQIASLRAALPPTLPLIANGNVITFQDVVDNRKSTHTQGVMSAEGLLDNPALFSGTQGAGAGTGKGAETAAGAGPGAEDDEDGLALALEYLDLATTHPVKTKCLVFHVRRMARIPLTQYQLMEDCLAANTTEEVRRVIEACIRYRDFGGFSLDSNKARKSLEAKEKRAREAGKRREYEARMVRKAKREGKDLDFYLLRGADAPTEERVEELRGQVGVGVVELHLTSFCPPWCQIWSFHLEHLLTVFSKHTLWFL